MSGASDTFVNHEGCRDAEQRVHAVTALEKGGKRGVREMILHLQQVNELWHASTLLNNLLKVEVGVQDELFNGFLVSEHTVFVRFLMFEYTEVRLSWHEQALLNDVNKTETKEVQWNMHEIRSGKGHQSQNVDLVTDDLRLNALRDFLFLNTKSAGLFSVKFTRLTDEDLAQLVGHILFVLEKDVEEVASENSQVLLFQEL